MARKKGDPAVVQRLRLILHEIFVVKGGGVATEAFGEDDWLLNMSSRVNAGEELTPDQRARIEEIRVGAHESDQG
jgi:hypothetical protein